jgi:membrane protein DedA with SNARE-associated domain
MHQLLPLLSQYGYTLLFANLFLEALGVPLPAIPILIAAGAACDLGSLRLLGVLVVSATAMLLGDFLMYLMGRYTGWALLGLLCRLTADPETCILRSAQSFYRRGRLTLVFAKYIPAINTMAPPLAGSLNMGAFQFLALDLLATSLYILPFTLFGYLFSHLVSRMVEGFRSLATGLEILVLAAILLYVLYRLRHIWRSLPHRAVPRATVQELAGKMASVPGAVLVADTRSHGYYDAGATRIKGSVRLEPNHLLDEILRLPKDKAIYLYCT